MAFASVPSLAAMFLGKFSAPSPVVDSLCLLLSTRPMVGTGEVSCPPSYAAFPLPTSQQQTSFASFVSPRESGSLHKPCGLEFPASPTAAQDFAHMREGSEEVVCPARPVFLTSTWWGPMQKRLPCCLGSR